MLAKGAIYGVILATFVGPAGIANAQTLLEQSAEMRMQLDLAVSPQALKALLPDGWEPFVATAGRSQGLQCATDLRRSRRHQRPGWRTGRHRADGLLRLADQEDRQRRDGRPDGDRRHHLQSESRAWSIQRLSGCHRLSGRTLNAVAAASAIENEDTWDFTGADGEHLSLHLTYERGVARKLSAETKFFSAADPNSYQIWKIDQGLDIMRNATVR